MTQDELIAMARKLVAAKAIAEAEKQDGDCQQCGGKGCVVCDAREQEPVALPCCGYTDASAVKWNSLNDVVQCHNCGQTYALLPQEKNT